MSFLYSATDTFVRKNIALAATVNKNRHLDSVRAILQPLFLQDKVVTDIIFALVWATVFTTAMIAPWAQISCQPFGQSCVVQHGVTAGYGGQ